MPVTKCPRCQSPSPERHPSMQADGGEVEVCTHRFHATGATEDVRRSAIAKLRRDLEKWSDGVPILETTIPWPLSALTLSATSHRARLVAAMQRLLDCPDLGWEELEEKTYAAIEHANLVLSERITSRSALASEEEATKRSRELLEQYERDAAALRHELYPVTPTQEAARKAHWNPCVRAGGLHAEAFCLMDYRCRSCGAVEKLWNSRDGVTPFSIPCRSVLCNVSSGHMGNPMVHTNMRKDEYAPEHVPERGQRVFIDRSAAEARLLANVRAADATGRTAEELPLMRRALFEDFWSCGGSPAIWTVP